MQLWTLPALQAHPMTGWHVTRRGLLDSIYQDGLVLGYGGGIGTLFLYADAADAIEFARKGHQQGSGEDQPVLVQILMDGMTWEWHVEERWGAEQMTCHVREPILPHRLLAAYAVEALR